MSKYLRRDVAEASKIYQDIKNRAIGHLKKTGAFRKDHVVDELDLIPFADSIRWDYVRDMIRGEAEGLDVIPMADSYFRSRVKVDDAMVRNTSELQQSLPERFIAMGHGKKTAGYALVEPRNGHFIVVVARNKFARATGVKASAERFTSKARQMGCVLPEATETLQVEETRRKA